MKTFLVCTDKPWHISLVEIDESSISPKWKLIKNPSQLTLPYLNEIKPRYIFFPHWSWIVPDEIINKYECICFHSTDVPYGRGGSPIQNLIIREKIETKITALKMIKELDAGPVYIKRNLSLIGRAQDIFEKSALIIKDMMYEIIEKEPIPYPQTGETIVFKRRKGNDNLLPADENLKYLYNHIRMLDAETYPTSHIIHGKYKIEFYNANLDDDLLTAKVKIMEIK